MQNKNQVKLEVFAIKLFPIISRLTLHCRLVTDIYCSTLENASSIVVWVLGL